MWYGMHSILRIQEVICVTYTRNGRLFDWLQSNSAAHIHKMLTALRSYGAPISNVKIEVK